MAITQHFCRADCERRATHSLKTAQTVEVSIEDLQLTLSRAEQTQVEAVNCAPSKDGPLNFRQNTMEKWIVPVKCKRQTSLQLRHHLYEEAAKCQEMLTLGL
jgi:hypothetical protein